MNFSDWLPLMLDRRTENGVGARNRQKRKRVTVVDLVDIAVRWLILVLSIGAHHVYFESQESRC